MKDKEKRIDFIDNYHRESTKSYISKIILDPS